MKQTMPKQLPTFKGYTVDFRRGEFRRVGQLQTSIAYIPFDSTEGLQLLEDIHASKEAAQLRPHIQRDPDDKSIWLCLCGNRSISQGFYPCDSEGEQVEPTPEYWATHCYVCDCCGRIIDMNTLAVVGARFHNTLTVVERQEIFACSPFPVHRAAEITSAANVLPRIG